MKVHWLQHVPFEGLGNIRPWLKRRGAEVRRTQLHAGQKLPKDASGIDLLIVMGGPMSVHDAATRPWLAAEKALVRDALDRGKRVLGVCLGAQLLAEALGAQVTPNGHREIGWHAVRTTADGAASPLLALWPARFVTFHWHGETFGLPPGAVHLLKSEACAQQAFSWGDGRAVGLQFHPEMTHAGIAALCAAEAPGEGAYVQDEKTMLEGRKFLAPNHRRLAQLLDRMTA